MKKMLISLFLLSFLGGCSHAAPLKAPCAWSGAHCSPRIKINQWDNQQ